MEMGRYLCVLRKPGHIPVRYPVFIERQAHWTGRAPGDSAPTPVWLPTEAEATWVDRGCYVPAGWFLSGDPEASHGHPVRWLWCDSVVMQRFVVTNRDYLQYLNGLLQQGREDEALEHAPRAQRAQAHEPGRLVYGRRTDGTFELVPDYAGDVYPLDWPVHFTTWEGNRAYLAWWADQTGEGWRLPGSLNGRRRRGGWIGGCTPGVTVLIPRFATWHTVGQNRCPPRCMPFQWT